MWTASVLTMSSPGNCVPMWHISIEQFIQCLFNIDVSGVAVQLWAEARHLQPIQVVPSHCDPLWLACPTEAAMAHVPRLTRKYMS